jgi:hypothetical protein
MLVADRFEPNNTFASATNFGTLTGRIESGLSIHAGDDDDYYRFVPSITAQLTADVLFTHAQGDIDVDLYDGNKNLLAFSSSTTDNERIIQSVTGGQTYYLFVYGFLQAINDNYTLDLRLAVPPDRFEPNNSFGTATNLGTLTSRTEANLTVHEPDIDDYYRFVPAFTGTMTLDILFSHAAGDVDADFYDAKELLLARSGGVTDNEQIISKVTAGQTYYLRVYGFGAGVINPNYTAKISIVASNSPPIAINDSLSTNEDTQLINNVLLNDFDPDGDPLTAVLPSVTSKGGSLSSNPNGSFTYTPTPNFFGADTFTYTAQDPQGFTATANVTINVGNVNDSPDAVNDVATVASNSANNFFAVLVNDTDADGDKLFVSKVTSPLNGTVSIAQGSNGVVYTPNPNFVGSDSFTYTASDGVGGSDTASVTVTIQGNAMGTYEFEATKTSARESGALLGETVPRLTVFGNFSLISNPAERTVNFSATKLGTATLGQDYKLASFIIPQANFPQPTVFDLTFTNTPNTGPSVTILNDALAEGNEFFEIVVFDASASIEPDDIDEANGIETTSQHTIVDDDKATVTVRIAATDQAAEPANDGEFTVTLSAPTTTATTITYNAAGTAANGVDYKAITGFLSIPAGFTSATILIDTIDDLLAEGTETVFVALSTVSGSPGIVIDTTADDATVNIADNDASNLPPIVTTNTGSTVTRGGADVITANELNTTDPDTLPGNLVYTVTSLPLNGTIRVNGSPSAAFTQAQINVGSVSYLHNGSQTSSDSFTFSISDGITTVSGNRFNFTVAPLGNIPPIAGDDKFATPPNTAVSGNVLLNDSDPDGDTPLFAGLSTPPANGSVVLQSNGNFTYTPNAGFLGTDTFQYLLSDGKGGTDLAQVTITVSGAANRPPIAVNDFASAAAGTKVQINVLTNDSDPDPNDVLTVISLGVAANGQASIGAGGLISYQPNPNFVGVDLFTYTISDGRGGTATAAVTVTVGQPGSGATDDTFKVNEDTLRNPLNVLANDFDPEGHSFKVTAVTQSMRGVVEIGANGSNVLYTPDPNFSGIDVFTYTITDTTGSTDTATVTVTVVGLGEPPIAGDDKATMTEDGPPLVINVLANDIDPDGGALKITSVTQGKNGTVTIRPTGLDLVYLPNPNFSGADTFTYTIADPEGNSDTATVTVTVEGINEIDARGDSFSAPRGVATFFGSRGVLANDVDPEGDAITKATVVAQSLNGVLVLNTDGSFTYTSNPGFSGIDSFIYRAFDWRGASDTASVTIDVIDAPPEPLEDAFALGINSGKVFINVLQNDRDPEDEPLEVIAVTKPSNGTATFTPTGVTYQPDPGFVGDDQFTYTISDGEGEINATAIAFAVVDVTVVPAHIPYFAQKDKFTRPEDTVVTLTEADLLTNDHNRDGVPVDIGSVSDAVGGTVMLNPDGKVSFSPLPNFVGRASFKYAAAAPLNLNAAVVQIDFTPLDDGPNSMDDAAIVSQDGSTGAVSVLLNDTDVDGDLLTVAAVTQGLRGSVAIGDFGFDVVYTPPPDFSGSDTFTYTVSDGNGGTDTATVTVTVGSSVVGTPGDDVFLLRRSGLGSNLEVFANAIGLGAPLLSVASGSLPSLLFDTLGGNDHLIVNLGSGGPLPSFEFRGGTGSNTIDVQGGSMRIDASVDAGGTLITTVGAGAELITNRFRQTSLTLAPGSRATVLAAGTLDAVSRLNALTIGAGATLDINDNALVLDYSGASPEAAIRAKILEGRGGVGIGNGNWNGSGLTSSAAAAANELNPESRAIGYADNGTLPLGPYTIFRGQPVDASSLLIAFTRTGDVNLDSLVDDNDATILAAVYPSASANWATADLDFTGTLDDNDATLLGAFYDLSAITFPAAAAPLWVLAAANEAQAHDAIFADIGERAVVSFRRRR